MTETYHSYRNGLLKWLVLGLFSIILLTAESAGARHRKKSTRKLSESTSTIHSSRLSRQAELTKLKREIVRTEIELKEHTRKERKTTKSIAVYDRKTKELKSKLDTYRKQATDLESEVAELDASIKQTTTSIDTLRSAYAAGVVQRYIAGVFRHRPVDTTILSSPEENTERLRRGYFVHIVSSAFHRNKTELDQTKTTLSENKNEVAVTLDQQMHQIDATNREERNAEEQKRAQSLALKQIQSSKQALIKELEKRKASAKRLEGIISNLVSKEEAARKLREKELSRRTAQRRKKRSSGKKLSQTEVQQEANDKIEAKSLAGPHSLSWPTSSHKVVQGFGEHRNKELGTVTMNLGIDIGTSRGSAVRSAGDGVISLISNLPSYGTIIIIRHGGGVHSVYADLSSVTVSSGSKVSKGQVIASSGENSELGSVLHFEVWKGKAKQNPLRWLK